MSGGLSLGVMGRATTTGTTSGYTLSGGTATQQGFGPGYTQGTDTDATDNSLLDSNPGSHMFWSGVGAIAALGLIRHALPEGKKWNFDLVVAGVFLGNIALSLPKLWAYKKLAETNNGTFVNDVAGAVALS